MQYLLSIIVVICKKLSNLHSNFFLSSVAMLQSTLNENNEKNPGGISLFDDPSILKIVRKFKTKKGIIIFIYKRKIDISNEVLLSI